MLVSIKSALTQESPEIFESDNLLAAWVYARKKYPKCRLYKKSVQPYNDITPKTIESLKALSDISYGDYHIIDFAGEPITIFYVALALVAAVSVYTYLNMPEVNQPNSDSSGSPNNSLANRQNKSRPGERVPDIYGHQKSISDLIAPVYRYYVNNVQTEECLFCVGTGYFEIDVDLIKESDTPIKTIEGASLSIYEPGTVLTANGVQLRIGEEFTDLPLVTKQVSSIDGKQTLISPNSNELRYKFVSFSGNVIAVTNGVQYVNKKYSWSYITSAFMLQPDNVYADFAGKFASGEQIIIENAIFGSVNDVTISGTTDVATAGVLTIATSIDINNPNDFKKIRVVSLLVDDAVEGLLDLAGEYNVDSIAKSGSTGTWIYTVTLSSNFGEVNPNFTLLSANTSGMLSGVLTDNDNNIDLSGAYTIATISSNEIVLVNPASVNSDWNRLSELTSQQVADMLNRHVTFKGSSENFIGWYYAGSNDTTGFILNFLAQSGIYEGDRSKQVAIEVDYQQVIDGVPTGTIYKVGDVMQGTANNRNPIGMTIKQALPFTGQCRFRVKRVNDNGNSEGLIDDVVFESAYSYYVTQKPSYPLDTIIRLKRLAIGSGTNASELNLEVVRKLYTYESGSKSLDISPTRRFSDILCEMALDHNCGRMTVADIDIDSIYSAEAEILSYFGIPDIAEFNHTFDDTNISYQESIFILATAIASTARRENGLHFIKLEKLTQIPKLLFNSQNTKPESLTVSDTFGILDDYDGLEVKWINKDNNFIQESIKLPTEYKVNYKTIELTGVINYRQAMILANREWNKLKFANKSIKFDAYSEHNLVTRADKIFVADLTAPLIADGCISDFNGLTLTLDQEINLDSNKSYVIHLQLKDGSVDVIDVQSHNGFDIILARPPTGSIALTDAVAACYTISESVEPVGINSYLLQAKDASSSFEAEISAIIYDDRFYSNDFDFKDI